MSSAPYSRLPLPQLIRSLSQQITRTQQRQPYQNSYSSQPCHHRRHNSSKATGNIIEETKFDQTKEDNNPAKPKTAEHMEKAEWKHGEHGHDHPAKQPDPQPSPSRSTGFEPDGPGSSRAGQGRDEGVTMDRGAGPHMKQ